MKIHEKKKKEAMKKSSDQENVVVLSLVIEASIEASFQVSVTKCSKMGYLWGHLNLVLRY